MLHLRRLISASVRARRSSNRVPLRQWSHRRGRSGARAS